MGNSFEWWFGDRINRLKKMSNDLSKLNTLLDKLSHQSMNFRAVNPKFAYWYDEDAPSKADCDRKECQKYLKFLEQQRSILIDLRVVSTRYYYYCEAVLAMRLMLIDAVNTHYERQSKHIHKALNGDKLCQKLYSLICKKNSMIRQIQLATNGVKK